MPHGHIDGARQQLEGLLAASYPPGATECKPSDARRADGAVPLADAAALKSADNLQQLTDELSELLNDIEQDIVTSRSDAPDPASGQAASLDVSASSVRPGTAESSAVASTSQPSKGLALLPSAPSLSGSWRGQGLRRRKHLVAAAAGKPSSHEGLDDDKFMPQGVSAMSTFMAHFQRGKVLSRDEEQALALATKDYLQLSAAIELIATQLKRPPALHEVAALMAEDEGSLRVRLDAGCRARAELAQGNYRLVLSVVRKFKGRAAHTDLLLAGMEGLMNAVRKFQPSSGYKFGTYATWWIRQAVQSMLASEAVLNIKVPRHQIDSLNRLDAAYHRLYNANPSHKPTDAEIAAATGMTESAVTRARASRHVLTPLYLDEVMDGEGGGTIGDSLEVDNGPPTADQVAMQDSMQATLDEMAIRLGPQGAAFIDVRYDPDGAMRTALSKKLRVSRQHINSVQLKVLAELKQHAARHLGELRDAPLEDAAMARRPAPGYARK